MWFDSCGQRFLIQVVYTYDVSIHTVARSDWFVSPPGQVIDAPVRFVTIGGCSSQIAVHADSLLKFVII